MSSANLVSGSTLRPGWSSGSGGHRRLCGCVNCIMPPYILKHLLESSDREIRKAALDTLLSTAWLRGERSVRTAFATASGPANGRRTIFDCHGKSNLPSARLARSEDGAASSDKSVNAAFDGLGKTRDFYRQVLDRNSLDGRGMRLDGYVHYGVRFNNAFFDGQQMVFGDGDGILFGDFTDSLDVIAHELTHGVTQFTAGLDYQGQSGALNESISDVFGSLVKQWSLDQTAEEADWLIGADIFTPGQKGDALRSMKAPGTAFDNDRLGKDPQPDNMSNYQQLPDDDDNGGVHINSGIPNKAFYLTATAIGGVAWEAPGHIWYEALGAATATTDFQTFADLTYGKAGQLYGTGSHEQQSVQHAWREVGIRVSGMVAGRAGRRGRSAADGREVDTLAALSKQMDALSSQVRALQTEVSGLRRSSRSAA